MKYDVIMYSNLCVTIRQRFIRLEGLQSSFSSTHNFRCFVFFANLSPQHRAKYFAKCQAAIEKWSKDGPQPLNTIPRGLDGEPLPVEEVEKLKNHHREHHHPPKRAKRVRFCNDRL